MLIWHGKHCSYLKFLNFCSSSVHLENFSFCLQELKKANSIDEEERWTNRTRCLRRGFFKDKNF